MPKFCLIGIYILFLSIKYSRELSSKATSLGASFRSDKDSVSHYGLEEIDPPKAKPVSVKRLYSMIGPDWIFGVFGTVGAFVAGAQMPLFALGVTQALISYYMDWETTKREVKKISLLFCGGAVLTVIFHVIGHLNFGIMGERLTLRVREKMFGGEFNFFFVLLFLPHVIFSLHFGLLICEFFFIFGYKFISLDLNHQS